MNPQMLAQLFAQAGGQPQGVMGGPESLMAILASLGLGGGQGAPGQGSVMGLQQNSMQSLLPMLLQAFMGAQSSGSVTGQQGGGQRSGSITAPTGGGGGGTMQPPVQMNPIAMLMQMLGYGGGGGRQMPGRL